MGLVEDVVSRLSWLSTTVIVVVSIVAYQIYVHINEEVRLRRTGALRARRYPGRLPLAVDLVVRSIRAAKNNTNREHWERIFAGVNCHTAEFRVMGRRVIFTDDVENIKAVLAAQFGDYGKGEPFHQETKPFLGDSIFATDGASWHASRQLLRPQFIKDRVSDLHIFESHLDTLFTAMAVCGDAGATAAAVAAQRDGTLPAPLTANGRVIDMSDLFFRYTLDVITDFLLGKDTESLTTPRQEFAEAFNEVQHVQSLIIRTGPAQDFIPRRSYNRGLRVIDEFIKPFIDGALRLSPQELEKNIHDAADGGESGGSRYTFLHALAQFTRDRKVLRDQLMAVLLAGRDTTAATLSWAIYELGRNPEYVKRLRAEIAGVVGVEGSPDGGGGCRPPTYADLKAMKFLQHVLNETLRMYPAVPYNVRLALKDTTLPRGGGPDGTEPVAILKDTPIGYSTLLMQRRPDLYPGDQPHPDVFDPDRWNSWQPRPWQYIPFNGGPRICIGQQFALTEMGYVLVRMFQKYERVVSHMGPVDGGKPTLKADIVLVPGDGVRVAFFEAAKV